MPIQEKDLGKYKRPAIYIEEKDNSIVDSPAQDILINLVPGFSKKGPFNNPIYVDNKNDFTRIFGEIDYQLERKGSFFHRTCLNMLETGPIWALNLLSTKPNRDQLNYVSISSSVKYTSSDFTNPYTADYERFFNRQDFWIRDEESFMDVVNDPTPDDERLLHFSNMGDKTITVFTFKSEADNFNVTAEQWYEGVNNVPQYIHPKSLISDYLVDVLIVAGDWTDYKTLSVDSTWSKYFTIDGLIISKIQDFVNEYGVTTLGNYDVSLIPNFKDLDGRDMYIENVINNNTDKTSLFCTYNQDLLLDSDYLTDLVDLVGDTIVGENYESINFLSYKQNIKETLEYPNVSLDSENNVFGTLANPTLYSGYEQTNLNWYTNMQYQSFNTSTLEIQFNNTSTDRDYYIINGVTYNFTYDKITLSSLENDKERKDIIYLDADGIQVQEGIVTDLGAGKDREINFDNNNVIILGTMHVVNDAGSYTTSSYEGITINSSGWMPIDVTTTSVTGSTEGDYVLINFNDTQGGLVSNTEYARLRNLKYFEEVATNLEANKGVIINNSGTMKTEIIDPISMSYTSLTDAQIKIFVDTPSDYVTVTNEVLLYYIDKEFNIDGTSNTITTTNTSTENVVAKYSNFYLDYINGEINNGDYVDSDVNQTLTMSVDQTGVLTVVNDFGNFSGTQPLTITTDLGNWKQTVEIEAVDEISDVTNTIAIKVDKERYSEVKRGYYLEAYYDEDYYSPNGSGAAMGDTTPRKLTRIVDVKNDTVNTSLKILYADAPIKLTQIGTSDEWYTTTYPPIYQYATHLKGASLAPFVLHKDSLPDGTEGRLNDILDVMGLNTSIFNGLVNKNKITWRYLIDAFGLGLQEGSKQQYLDVCGKKLNCLGFINMPSAKQFKKSTNPSFKNDDGSLSTTFIKEGGDQDKNPDFLYSFGQGTGRSTVGYFFPYVNQTIDGISKEVPPSSFVATTYMRKLLSNSSGVYPWTVAAGINNGIAEVSGTEMDFTEQDLDNFADMGANPITFIRNVGYIINDESTAQVFPVSSLSYIHSRELLIELENELYDMLIRYQWKFNTPTIRSEIKYRADRICQRYVETNGLYAYRNICDSTNNTNYIIDLQGGVLDTYIEITKAMGWIVNNITIEKTGTINSSGFQPQ